MFQGGRASFRPHSSNGADQSLSKSAGAIACWIQGKPSQILPGGHGRGREEEGSATVHLPLLQFLAHKLQKQRCCFSDINNRAFINFFVNSILRNKCIKFRTLGFS